jgi:PPOX class probable F420-dependent enzyme
MASPQMIALSSADDDFLRRARVARLATTSAAGHPHVVPVCFIFDGACLYSAIDPKPKRGDPRGLRRLRNLRENDRAALLVDHYEEDWGRLRYLLIHCRAEILEGGPDRERALGLLREKYPQYGAMPGFGDGPVIRLVPERAARWSAAERSDSSSVQPPR